MIDPREDALLNARLDGALTPEEARRLELALEHHAGTRQRAAQLEALVRALGQVEPSEPPADLVPQVMARVGAMADAGRSFDAAQGGSFDVAQDQKSEIPVGVRVVRWPRTDGGMTMARKAMWGLAAAAAVILGVLTYRGFPPVRGTEATVGAAKRAQAPQMAADSVTLADPEAQAFMQSDAFDRLIKDPAARKLLGDAAFARALSDPAFARALSDPAMMRAMSDPAFGRALQDPALMRAM
jgi:hypothetical protein